MKKIVLTGNPNVGKSLLFSRITRTGLVTANYAGTTVSTSRGHFIYASTEHEIIDGPGMYSLEDSSRTDEIARQLLDDADVILQVIDATNLERNLGLTCQLMHLQKPMVVCLNYWEDTRHKGITIDVKALSDLLGVPVVPVSALRSEGIPELMAAVTEACPGSLCVRPEERWNYIGEILSRVQQLRHRHHTVLERAGDFVMHPLGGILTAVMVLFTTLLVVRSMGEGMIDVLFSPFYEDIYSPWIHRMVASLPSEVMRSLLVGTSADPLQSFGVLTSGLYIALVQVFPYFFSFYFVFGLLEDFGYLPRLAVVLDRFFHRLGLHGYSSIPVMLGLGCKVPAFMATRSLTNRREKILTMSLILMSVPCLSQSAMIVSLGMRYHPVVIVLIYGLLLLLAVGTNSVLNRVYPRGETPEFIVEFPPFRMPSVRLMGTKLRVRIVEYFAEVLPMIGIGVLAMNVLDALGVLRFFTRLIERPIETVLGLPPEMAPILLMNFLRKDASVALLVPLHLDAGQFVIAVIFLVLSMPCVATLFTLVREAGWRAALMILGVVFCVATAASALLHGMLTLLV